MDDPATALFLFTDLRSMQMSDTSEEKIQAAPTDKQPEPAVPSRRSSQKSIFALSVFAFGLNAAAAVYTLSPSDFALPDVSGLIAELLPNQRAQAPIPEAVVAALKDIQSAQQQQAGILQENASLLQLNTVLLQQNTALRQQDKTTFDSLRKSITDEQVDVKKMSSQLSTLVAKVDSLQNAIATEITSSIPKGRARARLSGAARKRMARQGKPLGPVSVGGAPLTRAPGTIQSPEG
ncbi:MAG TPA: hypothetical protein VFK01_13430 [Bradyrhizobium sp.]|nr:hypothetical protein [Bradyrhizobium sp.]